MADIKDLNKHREEINPHQEFTICYQEGDEVVTKYFCDTGLNIGWSEDGEYFMVLHENHMKLMVPSACLWSVLVE